MKKKEEKVYFNEQWKQMAEHLEAFIQTSDQEELHLFRVQVKKLRALLELLDSGSVKQPLSKDFKPVRKIFKHCGIIRNAYINLQLEERYQFKDEGFERKRLDEMKRTIDEVKASGKQYMQTIRMAHDEIAGDMNAVPDHTILRFYKDKLALIINSLNNLQFNEDLHQARKQIKTLLYNRKISGKALNGKLQLSNAYMDKLQDTIGNWHDNILALEVFTSEEPGLKPIITKIRRQNTRLKRYITALADDFEKKAILMGKI